MCGRHACSQKIALEKGQEAAPSHHTNQSFPAGKAGEGSNIQPSGLPVAQIPRVFVSPAGAVSPLHYDTATSFLAQVKGRKRLIFYPPEDLPSLYMHSRWSILRRRAKVDPADPNYAKYPRFKKLGGWQAVLEPGDILWFPGTSPAS